MSLGETKETKIGKDEAPKEQDSFDIIKKASYDILSQQRDNPDRPKKASELFREYVALTKDIKAIQTEIHELSKSSEIDFLSNAQRHLQTIDAVDHIEVWNTASRTFRADEPSEKQRAMNKELLETYITNTRKRKDFLVKYKEAMVGFQKSVEKAAAQLVRDTSARVEMLDVDLDPDRPKKTSELFREYIACMKGIKTIQMEIHELSGSEIDFLSNAQRHLQTIDAVDHIEVWNTASKTFRADELSEKQRAMNKELLETYITNTRKRKDFLVKYKEAMVGFQKSVEKAAEEADRWLSLSQAIQITTTNLSHIRKYYKKYTDVIEEIQAERFFERFSFSEDYNAFDTAYKKAQKVLKEAQEALNAEQGSAQVSGQYQRELAICNQDLSRTFGQINPYIKLEYAILAVDRLLDRTHERKCKELVQIIRKSGASLQPHESYQVCYQRCKQVLEAAQSNSDEAWCPTQSFQELKSSYQDLLCSFQEFRDYVDTQLLGFSKMSTFCTDDGKKVISQHWASRVSYDKMQSLQAEAEELKKKQLQGKHRFLEPPDISYNCHSLTFTNGRGGWIMPSEVEKILDL